MGGSFLGGAGGRLLPVSVPFRWFGAAVVFHALAWLALAAGAAQWPQWRGGPGWPLAALHLVTIGTLMASAIGASLQLLPVATRQAVRWPRAAALLWWCFVPGVTLLALGMGLARPRWMAAGAVLVITVLAAWALLVAANLRGARGMRDVVLHGWGAVGSLALLAASAAALVALWNGWPSGASRDTLRALHAAAGVLGVMGLLVLGLSAILLPMFALSPVPDEAMLLRAGIAAVAAVLLLAAAAFLPSADTAVAVRALALASAAIALALHVREMRRLMAAGMRRDLGRTARLIRIGWGAAALALVLAAIGLAADGPADDSLPWGALALLAAIGGWLMSMLFGVLQRVLPFLGSMHGARARRRRPPTPSALAVNAPLALHEVAHLAALALLAVALVTRSPAWLLAAAICGAVGALAFLAFFTVLMRRLLRALRTPADPA